VINFAMKSALKSLKMLLSYVDLSIYNEIENLIDAPSMRCYL
jgi:hypothetical protein